MISAAQMLCGLTAPVQKGEESRDGEGGLFGALLSLVSADVPSGEEGVGKPGKAGTKDEADTDSALLSLLPLFALMGRVAGQDQTAGTEEAAGTDGRNTGQKEDRSDGCGQVTDAVPQLPDRIAAGSGEQRTDRDGGEAAVTGATDFADILEGNFESGSMDTAPLQTADQTAGGEDEEIMARMPQIVERIGRTWESDAKGIKESSGGGPCPLENGSETAQTASGAAACEPAGSSGDRAETAEDRDGGESGPLKRDTALQSESGAFFLSTAAERPAIGLSDSPAQDGTAENAVSGALREMDSIIASYDYDETGNGRFSIRLEPEYLGKLSISLSMGKDGLSARIHTENTQVKDILAGQIGQLLEKLGDSGIQVSSVDVVCADPGWQQESRSSGGDSRQQRARTGIAAAARRGAAVSGDMELFDLSAPAGDSESSVDYRA